MSEGKFQSADSSVGTCEMRSFLLSVFQLDPQTVQSKNWHMDVIEMNGVGCSSEALSVLTRINTGASRGFREYLMQQI